MNQTDNQTEISSYDFASLSPQVFLSRVSIMLVQELEALLGLFLNLWYLITAIKNKHYQKRPTHLLMFNQAIADTMILSGVCFYTAPGILLAQFYPKPEITTTIFGLTTSVAWFMNITNIASLALERFVAVFFPLKYKSIFTLKRTVIQISILWVISFGIFIIGKLSMCCAGMIVRPEFYSMSHWNPDNSIDRYQMIFDPLNYISTFACLICYPSIVIKRVLARRKIRSHQTPSNPVLSNNTNNTNNWIDTKKSNQEMRLSIQFAIISSCFVLINLSFSCVTWFGGSTEWFNAVLGFAYIGNACINVSIYLLMNKEIAPQMLIVLCPRMIGHCKAEEARMSSTNNNGGGRGPAEQQQQQQQGPSWRKV